MSRFTCIIIAALAALAIAAPVATAVPIREPGSTPSQELPGPPTWPVDPEPIGAAPVDAAPPTGGDEISPLVYILPGLILTVLLAVGTVHAVRTSRRTRVGA